MLCFVDRAFRCIRVLKSISMHYSSSVYFVNQPLQVSGIFVAHLQDVYCIYTTIGTCCANRQSPKKHNTQHLLYIQVSQEECARLREGVSYVKVYRYNPKHLCPNLNGYGDNGQRKVWSSGVSTHCTCQLTTLSMSVLECGVILRQFSSRLL